MWQRFTERARRIVILAQQEAEQQKLGHVGTEHLLLALMREHESIPALLLRDVGITLDVILPLTLVVPSLLSPSVQTEPKKRWFGATPKPEEPKLTQAAKRMLELAADEARSLGHKHIGTEHLLLGLLRDPDTSAAQILRQKGLSVESLRQHCLKYIEPEAKAQQSGVPASQTHTEPATQTDPDRVVGNKAKWLLAVLERDDWSAIQILAESGLDIEAARQQLRQYLYAPENQEQNTEAKATETPSPDGDSVSNEEPENMPKDDETPEE